MKRICHLVQSYYPRDPRIRRQAEALAGAGYAVDVICLRGPGESKREEINGVNVIRLPLSRKRGSVLRYLFEYAAFFVMAFFVLIPRARRYSVIHVSNLPDFLVFAAAVPRLLGTKVLLDEHDPMPELFMSKYGVGKDHPIIKLVALQERLSLKFADHVLTVSSAMKQRYDHLVGGRPVSVVMNLPDDRLFQLPAERPRNNAANGHFTLIYTGTVSKTYNLDMVVEAVANLRSKIPGLRLKIVGEGDDIPALKELAEQRGVTDRVEFPGVVPFNKIPELISQSDVGVSTLKLDMLTRLCFNNKTAEYVAMGLPSIVTRTDVVQEHFPQGIVRFFEPGNPGSFEQAVVDLYENPDLRADMSQKGLEFSKTANWSTEKQKYIDLIERLSQGKI